MKKLVLFAVLSLSPAFAAESQAPITTEAQQFRDSLKSDRDAFNKKQREERQAFEQTLKGKPAEEQKAQRKDFIAKQREERRAFHGQVQVKREAYRRAAREKRAARRAAAAKPAKP